jgi:hypothetical protein
LPGLALTNLASIGTTTERQDEWAAGPVAPVGEGVSANSAAETRGRPRSQGRGYGVDAAGVLDDDSVFAGVDDDAVEDESLLLAELLDSVDEAVAPELLSLLAPSFSFFVVSVPSVRFEAEPFL